MKNDLFLGWFVNSLTFLPSIATSKGPFLPMHFMVFCAKISCEKNQLTYLTHTKDPWPKNLKHDFFSFFCVNWYNFQQNDFAVSCSTVKHSSLSWLAPFHGKLQINSTKLQSKQTISKSILLNDLDHNTFRAYWSLVEFFLQNFTAAVKILSIAAWRSGAEWSSSLSRCDGKIWGSLHHPPTKYNSVFKATGCLATCAFVEEVAWGQMVAAPQSNFHKLNETAHVFLPSNVNFWRIVFHSIFQFD